MSEEVTWYPEGIPDECRERDRALEVFNNLKAHLRSKSETEYFTGPRSAVLSAYDARTKATISVGYSW